MMLVPAVATPGMSAVSLTWIMFTVSDALVAPMDWICSFRVTVPTTWPPTDSVRTVFGAGTTVMAFPPTTRLTNVEPAALTWSPVASLLVVLTAFTSVAVISPASRFTSCTSAVNWDDCAVLVSVESPVVLIAPVVITGEALTEPTVLATCSHASYAARTAASTACSIVHTAHRLPDLLSLWTAPGRSDRQVELHAARPFKDREDTPQGVWSLTPELLPRRGLAAQQVRGGPPPSHT